jgi:DNA/RNA endonuclease G (NUC1)
MKKILSILIISSLFISSTNQTRRKEVIIKNDIYTINYSEVYEQPIKVVYDVKCYEGKFSRKGIDFYTVEGLITSDDLDYKGNDYDKGHMAPAASFNCNGNYLYQTFSYANCALQQSGLNRGTWKSLEERERDLARQTKVKVTIKIDINAKCKKLATGATVPKGFTKILEYSGNKESYYFPNIEPVSKDYKYYKI